MTERRCLLWICIPSLPSCYLPLTEELRASLYNRAQQLHNLAEGNDPTGRNLALGGYTAPIRTVLQARDAARAQVRAVARAGAKADAKDKANADAKVAADALTLSPSPTRTSTLSPAPTPTLPLPYP